MKKKIKKNIKQRYVFFNNEKKRLILKSLIQNNLIKKNLRWKLQFKFFNLPTLSSLTKIKNICILTGRSRGIFRFFKLSRIKLREIASKGLLPGFSKISW